MFKLVKNLAVWWPVSVLEPDSDNAGQLKESQFEVELVIRGKDELKAYDDARLALVNQLPNADDYLADAKTASTKASDIAAQIDAHDRKIFQMTFTNWRNVVDENDQPIAFSAEALDQALNYERVRAGLNRAYADAISQDKARLGNLKA